MGLRDTARIYHIVGYQDMNLRAPRVCHRAASATRLMVEEGASLKVFGHSRPRETILYQVQTLHVPQRPRGAWAG